MRVAARFLTAGLVVGWLAACGDGALAPAEVAGQYTATTFTIQLNGVTTELLARGASVNLQLKADGTTTGRLIMPAVSGVQLNPVDHDLAGTYLLSDDVIRLSQTADTSYLDDAFFTADPPELRAFITIADATRSGSVTLILTRQ